MAARGAHLLFQIEQEFGAQALADCLRQALIATRGMAFGEADLVRSFRQLDGRDLAPLLNRLASAYGQVPTGAQEPAGSRR